MRRIGLYRQGRVVSYALVDDQDYETLHRWRWRLSSTGYAVRHGRMGSGQPAQTVYMHRQVVAPGPGLQVDHANGVRTDNRRANLRVCTPRENARSRRRVPGAAAPYKGVKAAGRRWQSRLQTAGRYHHLGTYDTPREAARAYDAAARRLHGRFASPNFAPPLTRGGRRKQGRTSDAGPGRRGDAPERAV